MGTRGLIGYVHKGQKYIKENGHSSYPEGLGVELLAQIPSDADEFLRWLEEKRALLEKVEKEVTEKSRDPFPEELSRTSRPIVLEHYLEWIYVLNLDYLSFSVNDKFHFRLDNLPSGDEFLGYLAIDGSYDECIAPWTPEQYRAELLAHPPKSLTTQEQDALKYYDDSTSSVSIAKIDPSTWLTPVPQHLAVHEKLALLAAEGFMTARYALITQIHRYYGNIEVFEDLAKDILTAACHGGSTFTLDEQTARVWTCKVLNRPSRKEMIHYYWFRDRLICLVPTLVLKDHFKAEVGIVLQWLKTHKFSDLTAILWSINHVAVLVVSGDKISISDPIPVGAALGNRVELEKGLKLIMHYLPLQATDGSDVFNWPLPLDVVRRIMKLCEPDTQVTLSRTSRVLRFERLQRQYFGPYQLLSLDGDSFRALDEFGRHVILKLEPRRCLELDESRRSGNEGENNKSLTAYRKPIFFVNQFHEYLELHDGRPMRRTIRPLDVVGFSRIHGYRVQICTSD